MTKPELIVSPELVRRARPRRNHPLLPASKPKLEDGFPGAHKRWKETRQYWVKGFELGEDGPMAQLARAGDRILLSETFSSDISIDHAAAAERMLNHAGSILGGVILTKGLGAAVSTKLRSAHYTIAVDRKDKTTWWVLSEKPIEDPVVDSGWDFIRRTACAADEETYREALAIARQAREGAPLSRRIHLSFAFPGEADWANTDLDETNRAPDFEKHVYTRAALLASATNEKAITRFIELANQYGIRTVAHYACDIAVALSPEEATRVINFVHTRLKEVRATQQVDMAQLGLAMTSIRSEEMAQALGRLLKHRSIGPHAMRYFRRERELAKLVLPPIARQKSALGDTARHVLRTHDRSPASTRPSGDDEMPSFLHDMPWRVVIGRPALELETLPFEEHVVWTEEERAAKLERTAAWRNAEVRPMTREELAAFEAQPLESKYVNVWPRWTGKQWLLLEIPDEIGLVLWNEHSRPLYWRDPDTVLARWGTRAIPGLMLRSAFADTSIFTTQIAVVSPRVALTCSNALLRRSKRLRKLGARWLTEHSEAAAIGLIPVAFTKSERTARRAIAALSLVIAKGDVEVVRAVAARYGDAALAAVTELIDRDPLAAIDGGGRNPPILEPDSLPPFRSRSSLRLSPVMKQTILDVLRMAPADYPGFPLVRDALDPTSAMEVAEALFLTWATAGTPYRQTWMPTALATLGGDDGVRKLTSHALEWAHDHPKRSSMIAEVLESAGTDAAVFSLRALHDRTRYDLRAGITEALEDVARRRGVTVEALEDDAVPTLGLDAVGGEVVDFGARKFRLTFDEGLRPSVILPEGGRPLPQLPRPSKADDAVLAKAAAKRWRAIERDSRLIASTQVRRLERAMIARRQWQAADFERRLARHPLMRHLARRLVWQEGEQTFRIAEDGSYATIDDVLMRLPDDAVVSLPHPFFLSEDVRTGWGQLFADYDILQPFPQLGRSVFRPERGATLAVQKLDLFKGSTVEGLALVARIDSREWKRSTTGSLRSAARAVTVKGATAFVTIMFGPGIAMPRPPKNAPVQTLGDLTIHSGTFADLDPVELSEVLYDVETFRA